MGFYMWDEPDTQGRDLNLPWMNYQWAGQEWLAYSQQFRTQLLQMRSRGTGTKVTSPLFKAGGAGVLEQEMRIFMDACGNACLDPNDSAYIDVLAINAFCGPWNVGASGCHD